MTPDDMRALLLEVEGALAGEVTWKKVDTVAPGDAFGHGLGCEPVTCFFQGTAGPWSILVVAHPFGSSTDYSGTAVKGKTVLRLPSALAERGFKLACKSTALKLDLPDGWNRENFGEGD